MKSQRAWQTSVACLMALATTALADNYGIRDLGTLGGPTAGGNALNNFGLAAGFSTLSDANMHAFIWRRSGLVDLGPLAGDRQSHAFGINDFGDTVAMSYDLGELQIHGVLRQAGFDTDLGAFAPLDLNAARTVAGYVSLNDPAFGWVDHAARWSNGVTTDLGTLGGHFSYAYAVDDAGVIVGMSFTADEANRRAALWNGQWHDLGTLGGANSFAYDISEFGHVVGVADTSSGAPHAFLFNVDAAGNVTNRTDLGELGGGYSYAYAVSNVPQVVGTSNARAFSWRAGAMTDLNAVLPPGAKWRLDAATAVNDFGQIVGYGFHEGQPRAFLMSPYRVGDVNCDGSINAFDIEPFVVAISDPSGYAASHPECNIQNADTNGDGSLNGFDVQGFVDLLSNP